MAAGDTSAIEQTLSPITEDYEPPALTVLGAVHELTLHGGDKCLWGKQWGGSDGLQWMGINIPVSSC